MVCKRYELQKDQKNDPSVDMTLPETDSLHLKMDGWNTIVSFWEGLLFRGYVGYVSFRECK